MNIIDFPGNAGRKPESIIDRATRLKQRLVSFVHEGRMRLAFEEELRTRGLRTLEGYALIDFTDWFIFEWEGEQGECVLDEFLDAHPDLAREDREIVEGWYEAVDDVFEVVGRGGDGFLMRDEEGDEYVVVPTAMKADDLPWSPGLHISTRILPVGDVYLLSGIQSTASDRDSLLEQEEEDFDVDSVIGEILTDAFVQYFGGRETLVPAREVGDRLRAFYEFLFTDYQPKGAEHTFGELLRTDGGAVPDIELPEIELPDDALDVEVGLLADPDEGLAVVPYYGAVRRYVTDGEGDVEELREIVIDMLEDDQVPPFVFYTLADLPGGRFGSLLAEALDDPEFDMETDLDELLDEYKPAPEDELSEASESGLVEAGDLEDVRKASPFESFPGALAEALAAYAHKLESTLKPATFEGHLEGLNLLAFYAREEGIEEVAQLDAEALQDFLGVWYVRRWAERSVDGVKHLLVTIEKLTAWLDASRGARVGSKFKSLLPSLKKDVPRVVAAVCTMDEVLDERLEEVMEHFDDLMTGAAKLLDESEEGQPPAEEPVFVRTLSVLAVDGVSVRVAERPPVVEDEEGEDDENDEDSEPDEEITLVTLPEHVASLLRPGDVIEAEIGRAGDGWAVVSLIGAYPEGVV
jgi:hypothetical protein